MASSLLTALLIAIATAQVALAIYYPSCDPPHRPDNGGYNPSSNKYTVDSKINFFCNTGYKLHGASSTICKHIAKKSFWAHKSPVCKRKSLFLYMYSTKVLIQCCMYMYNNIICVAIRCSYKSKRL